MVIIGIYTVLYSDSLEMTEAEAEAAISNLIASDNDDDDPDPNDPNGGGSRTPSSGGGSSTGKKSTRPYNIKSSAIENNSADKKSSSLAQYGEPLKFMAEPT